MMESVRFWRPNGGYCEASPNLYVANCGPALGISFDKITSFFSSFGDVNRVCLADESGARVIVCFAEDSSARLAFTTLHGHCCPDLGGRRLHISYSVLRSSGKVHDSVHVSLLDSELKIPGVFLLHDFITNKEEQDLLKAVDEKPWNILSKRRVQHYGYEFCYQTRNINAKEYLGELPPFVSPILERISSWYGNGEDLALDQLTVNEYPPGVGLSPHIDTHSAFGELIFSLSMAGPCVMEFRKYSDGVWGEKPPLSHENKTEEFATCLNVLKKAIYLPPRSLLLLSGESRYAWHHYIPHHKIDLVRDNVVKRGSRRVSFTFRKARKGPCQCQFHQHCDSRLIKV